MTIAKKIAFGRPIQLLSSLLKGMTRSQSATEAYRGETSPLSPHPSTSPSPVQEVGRLHANRGLTSA